MMNPEDPATPQTNDFRDPLSRKSSSNSDSDNSRQNFVDIEDAIANTGNLPNSPSTPNVVGRSIFYDCLDPSQESFQKSDTDEDAATYEIDPEYKNDGNFTIFGNIIYLGSANINVPKSEAEIQRHINELNTSSTAANLGARVKISIPNSCEGVVVLYDEETDAVFSQFDIQFILFYARANKDSPDHACFAFSWSHGESHENSVYQCHIFRCGIPEAINHVSACFTKAFKRIPSSMACSIASDTFALNSITSDTSGNPLSQAMYEFTVSLEIREKVAKNTYTNVVREKSCFKLRQNCDKEICITVKQTPSENLPALSIERCFGVLLSVGKIMKQGDMQLLELSAPGAYLKGSQDFQIVVKWDLTEKPAFEQLNESQKSHLITLAVDLVIKGISEPVRFVVETKVENSDNSRFSNSFLFQGGNKRPLLKKFYIQLKGNSDNTWILSSVDPSDEILEPVQSNSFNQKFKNFSKMVRSTSTVSFGDFDDISQSEDPSGSVDLDDEPLASGTGEVSRDCSEDRLNSWAPVIQEWQTVGKRPKNLAMLIRSGGIPEALRCQFWQKLAYTENRPDLADQYRILITKETKSEQIILRDIGRTFPAHDFFRDDGNGQEALYKVSKAYSVYDQEVSYCQGLSFIAASLLLHMPEEEAFTVLVSIMYDYGLRELYKTNFENLSKCLFQLTCLIRDQLPDLYEHFLNHKLELHMFASHWFLTLFTARFPLPFVFHCIDLFLLDGINVLFQIAFALLTACRKELLSRDFESMLKYIRVSLPKKFRSEAQVSKLIRLATECKVKKLKKYEEEFLTQKEENEKFERMLSQYQMKYHEDRKNMQNEIQQLQQRIKKYEIDEKKYESIIHDYKQIIQRQEQELDKIKSPEQIDVIDGTKRDKQTVDSLEYAAQRIRELEMDLAQSKVSQVESECLNQKLQHQLNSFMAKNAVNPTTNNSSNSSSWKAKWDNLTTAVNNVAPSVAQTIPSFQSHISDLAHQLNSFDESKKVQDDLK